MANGKGKREQYTPERKAQALALLYVKSLSQVAAESGIPKSTLKGWRDAMKACEQDGTPCEQQAPVAQSASTSAKARARGIDEAVFVEETARLTMKTLETLNVRIETACGNLKEVYELRRFILDNKELVLSHKDREKYPDGAVTALLSKLEKLEVINMGDLSKTLGIAYDKYALASGKATTRVAVGFEDYPE